MNKSQLSVVVLAVVVASAINSVNAFVTPSRSNAPAAATTTSLQFGTPTFQPKKDDDGEDGSDSKPVKKMDLKGLAQLVTAGMGAPFLGDFEGVDEESGKFMFSLEANNLVDEDGKSKQTSMPYFESGWVDEEEEARKKEGGGFKFPWQK
eukprot:CAMPEP_0119561516 /NCGR_PEP_ID=MMETSP1352-20130426/17828_1 /TAXON_ID=265584 /ORGANISM="Stauroneis constricta, Strain CCMP1120" /LENGTH=149 /DNA_ID=CAMNT_0007609733 /DNA_START=30 /DNA_END=479 /DNA_ORIENTATION=+